MSKRRDPLQTFTTPSTALQQFLSTANLPAIVPQLPARALHRLVAVRGLEDSGDVLMHATGEQLRTVMDADLWSGPGSAVAAALDAERFGRWLQVLVDASVETAARQLQEIDRDLIIGAFAQHVGVCSRVTAERRGLLESAPTWECGAVIVWARREDAWDAIATLLAHMQGAHPQWLSGLLAACRELSYEHLEEASGFDVLLGRRQQMLHDLASAREQRREVKGYVTRADAHAFLESARRPASEADVARDAEVRSYLSALADASPGAHVAEPHHGAPAADGGADDVTRLVALVEGCEAATPVRGLLAGPADTASPPASRMAGQLAALAQADPITLDVWQQELGFLANCLLESGVLPAARRSESDAVSAAMATCDLGLERLSAAAGSGASAPGPVAAFREGWSSLHTGVSMPVAEELLRTLKHIPLDTSEFNADVRALRMALQRALAQGRPWDAMPRLEVLAILDLPTWSTLTGLLAELPVVPQGCLDEQPVKRLRQTTEVEFIGSTRHLAWVRSFSGGIGERLSS